MAAGVVEQRREARRLAHERRVPQEGAPVAPAAVNKHHADVVARPRPCGPTLPADGGGGRRGGACCAASARAAGLVAGSGIARAADLASPAPVNEPPAKRVPALRRELHVAEGDAVVLQRVGGVAPGRRQPFLLERCLAGRVAVGRLQDRPGHVRRERSHYEEANCSVNAQVHSQLGEHGACARRGPSKEVPRDCRRSRRTATEAPAAAPSPRSSARDRRGSEHSRACKLGSGASASRVP
mmetsp:Transcript_2578/g.8847  ORF Transcript_2578/g.8847 Transcript_2578/m.8847 type:complete len:240 (-) Transcript_2578:207-926(-)